VGGPGSGNWYRYSSKATVEDCLSLDINKLQRNGILFPGASGSLTWTNTATGEQRGSVGYRIAPMCYEERLVLWISFLWRNSEKVDRPITLEPTYPHYGGRRYWFHCPVLQKDMMPCWRRVGKLYLPSGARFFGCRQCYDLTYRSCQEAHQAARLFMGMGLDREFAGYMASEWAKR
jgi:hypothetical protein